MATLDVVVGGQFGSEGKGHVTQRVVERREAEGRSVLNIRVAGPNAGHTVVGPGGVRWPMRQIPVGFAMWAQNEDAYQASRLADLAIAAGSEIDLDVLLDEIQRLQLAGLLADGQLTVDPEATLISSQHKAAEQALDLVGAAGSTGKGVGVARADRVVRRAKRLGDMPTVVGRLKSLGVAVADVASLASERLNDPQGAVVIEGTQGFGLGSHAGYYPYATSSDCRAVDFLAMAGISPWHPGVGEDDLTVWVTVRPFPIRIAGNSGPLMHETTWEELGLEPEITTVTRKTRRVGRWNPELARVAVAANGGAPAVRVAFTMLDQVFPDLREGEFEVDGFPTNVANWLLDRALEMEAQIELVTFGPDKAVWL